MKTKSFGLHLGLIFAIVVMLFGATYAFYAIGAINVIIGGRHYDFEMDLNMTSLKTASAFIPIKDSYIPNVIDNNPKCVDANGYEVCSLFQLDITNMASANTLTGFVKTVSSGYSTSNLKCQLYTYSNSKYTAISDVISLSPTAGTENEFTIGGNDLSLSIADGSVTEVTNTYFLAVWLSETDAITGTGDQGKTYMGQVVFDVDGGQIQSRFNT